MHSMLNMPSSVLIVFFVTFVIIYFLLNRSRKRNMNRRLPPALPSLPIVGSLPFLFGHENAAVCFTKMSKKLGDVFSLTAGSSYIVVLNGRQAFREALTTRGTDFANRPQMYGHFFEHNGNKGIFFRFYDESFKETRKQSLSILKAFGFGKRLMQTRIQQQVTELLANIREMGGKPFNPHDTVMMSIGNLILSIMYGRRFELDDHKIAQLIHDIEFAVNIITPVLEIFPVLRFIPYYQRMCRRVRERTARIFYFGDTCLAETLQDDSRPECFVNSFVDIQGPNFDRIELLYILRDFTYAGLDTTTGTILWALVLLANRRSVQDRLQAEIDSVVGRDRQPTLDDRKSLPYVEATLHEIMRFKTLTPFSMPHETLCDTSVSGYFVPARTMVVINMYAAHHDPDTWQDPDQFRPERFLDESGHLSTLKDCVIPFSLGKRACPGEQLARQEVFLLIASIMQEFDVCPPEGQDHIDETEKLTSIIQSMPFEIRFIPRKY